MEDTLRVNLSDAAVANVLTWLEQDKYAEYCSELQTMIDGEQWQELEDAFFKVIEFGTAGRRGTTGVGSNRINRVTIGESAQALCLYALSVDANAAEKGVVIACDTRLSSPELSRYAAQVCAFNGFKTYIFEDFRSTPELSFAVRELGCAVGIVITASHNPPADNGFKAYWSDGGQLVAPHDKGVMEFVAQVDGIHTVDFDDAVEDGHIVVVGQDIDTAYIAAVTAEAEGTERDVNVVYSPLHGAGQTNTLPTLRMAGFDKVSVVAEQMVPDGNFPTIEGRKPNPEEKIANHMAVMQMIEEGADIAITNDPDADRIGIIVHHQGEAMYLSGNQSAILATDYALRALQQKGSLTPKHFIVKTIVTTDMLNALADAYGVTIYGEILIGFKYIGELLLQKERTDEIFVIGAEESYGLLKGTYARDKDGAAGALPVAEYAAELKRGGLTLFDRLLELYGQYGIFAERLYSITYPGATGFQKMQSILERLRKEPPKTILGEAVTAVLDYSTLKRVSTVDGTITDVACNATGNAIVLEFGDKRRRMTVRPSGTEPKLKVYAQWYQSAEVPDKDGVHAQLDSLDQQLDTMCADLESILVQ